MTTRQEKQSNMNKTKQTHIVATVGGDRHYHQVHGGWTSHLALAQRGTKKKMQAIADDCEGIVEVVAYTDERRHSLQGVDPVPVGLAKKIQDAMNTLRQTNNFSGADLQRRVKL